MPTIGKCLWCRYPAAIACAFFALGALAGENTEPLLQLLVEAKQLQLANSTQWLALGHYHRNLSGKLRSHVQQRDFFLSDRGATDPGSELQATLAALFTDDSKRLAIQCHYIARYRWLKTKLDISTQLLPISRCSAYRKWRQRINPATATLVFPAAYLNAPSSMFGHTLLRLDPPLQANASPLLSYAVNFAADVPDGTNGVAYLYQGLAGGFIGRFFIVPYHDRLRKYQRMENRDIWEYNLNLRAQEINRMVDHIWELRNIGFDYHFLNYNCSYRLLELLDVARPGSRLADHFTIHAIPVDTVRLVDQDGFVENRVYRPSAAKRLRYMLSSLTTSQMELVETLAHEGIDPDAARIRTLSLREQQRVISGAYRYLQYRMIADRHSDQQSTAISYQLIKRLGALPFGDTFADPPSPVPPDKGHRSARLSAAIGRQGDTYIQIGYRPAYHDLTDNLPGFDEGAEIVFLNTDFRIKKDQLSLQQFDLLRIRSFTPRDTFSRPFSWQLDIALERDPAAPEHNMTGWIGGGRGVSYSSPGAGLVYSLATARLEYNRNLEQNADTAPGLTIGMLRRSGTGSTQINLDAVRFLNSTYTRYTLTADQNIRLDRNNALRFRAQCGRANGDSRCDLQLSLLLYL